MRNYFLEYINANTVAYRPEVINEVLSVFENTILFDQDFYEELFELNQDILDYDLTKEEYRNSLFSFCLAHLLDTDTWFEDIEIVKLDIENHSCTFNCFEELEEELEEAAEKIGFVFKYLE